MWKSVKNWLQKWTFLSGEIFLHILELSLSNVKNVTSQHVDYVHNVNFSNVQLCVQDLFPCASMCARFIPMCIYVCNIYSNVHLCVHHLFPSISFIPMCIYVYIIYSNVHICVHHFFLCASMCVPFIPMCIYVCTIYLFPCASLCALFIPMCMYVWA